MVGILHSDHIPSGTHSLGVTELGWHSALRSWGGRAQLALCTHNIILGGRAQLALCVQIQRWLALCILKLGDSDTIIPFSH